MLKTKRRAILKLLIRVLFLIIGFSVILYSLNIWNQSYRKHNQPLETNYKKVEKAFPIRLRIPAINIDVAVVKVGINDKGEMDVPGSINDVGWFELGTIPGEPGSAAIDGHLNGPRGEDGVFAHLDKLKIGDVVYVDMGDGTSKTFVVREKHTYVPGYADEVFSSNEGIHLNLISCFGVWNVNKKSYSKRLVIFTDLVP